MRPRRFGQRRKRRRRDNARQRKMIWATPNVSRKHSPSGEPSGSLTRHVSPLSRARPSHTRAARRNSRSSSTRLSTSHSLTTRRAALCGRHLLTSLAVSLKTTSPCRHSRTSARVTRLAALKRLVKMCSPSSAGRRWSRGLSRCPSSLGRSRCARRRWTTSTMNSANSQTT